MLRMTSALVLAGMTFAAPAFAVDAPAEIKIGTLYASSGRYASISMPVFSALKLWADQKNADGGAYVKAFDKKIPVKLIAYDDQSNTATASTLYNQLVTQDKVDLLASDSGSGVRNRYMCHDSICNSCALVASHCSTLQP